MLAESVNHDSATSLDQYRRPVTASVDPALAAFAQLATLRLNAERTLISLFDGKRQHIVAEATRTTAIELSPDDDHSPEAEGTALLLAGIAIPRNHGACEHVLDLPAVIHDSGNVLLPISIVPDLAQDNRFAGRPLFGPASPLRFYAGVPIRSPQGIDLGVCCIFDSTPREGLGTSEQRFLRHTSGLIMSHLQCRVSTDSYRRHERMVRGLGSMVEGTGSMSNWRGGTNPQAFENVAGREGALNVQQQHIQRFGRRLSSPTIARPIATPIQPDHTTEDEFEAERPTESTDTVDTVNAVKSSASYAGVPKDEYHIVKSLFSRTANIIRESIEVEGALFLDAAIESFGGLVPNDVEGQQRSEGSSGEDSVATDDSMWKQESCRVLGFSTSITSSINGDAAPEEHTTVSDTFLAKILRRYAGGQVFNFDEEGVIIWAGKYSVPLPRSNMLYSRKIPRSTWVWIR